VTTVLYACIHNSGRSVAAAALTRHYAGGTVEVRSAGSEPGSGVNPVVAAVLAEKGMDVAQAKPQKLTEALAREAQLLITMGCGDQCPIVPGLARDDWPLEDPKGKPRDRVRAIRDDIEARVRTLLSSRGWLRL